MVHSVDECHQAVKHEPSLTHLSLDKMAAISQTIFSDAFLWKKSFVFWSKFVSKGPIHKKLAMVKIMAWRRIGWSDSLTHICGTELNCPHQAESVVNQIHDPYSFKMDIN